jgi:hypothetical protein
MPACRRFAGTALEAREPADIQQAPPAGFRTSSQGTGNQIALTDAQRLDHYHRLERERIHLLLIDEAGKGLDDVAAGRVKEACGAIQSIKRRRSA